MVEVKEIEVNITLPNDGIGMVIMQPYVELTGNEPYCWQDNKKNRQIKRIIRTLEIAKKADHGCEKTHFTIFPEYSIPGLDGVDSIQKVLEDAKWSTGTVVIGGVDNLTKDDYSALCDNNRTHVHEKNRADKISGDEWLNCCIVWAKDQNGTLNRWIQPKIAPSWPEKNITYKNMFSGKSVYIFKGIFGNGTPCRFLSLICFDWISQINPGQSIGTILSRVNDYWKNSGERKDIHFIFVIQRNDEPNHDAFLGRAKDYFEDRNSYPFVRRDDCVIIFANNAGGCRSGKCQTHGYSSLIYSPKCPYDTNGCPPTFAVITKRLRGKDSLGRCKEALFREMGACIHSFNLFPPPFVNLGPGGRCLPIEKAIVHAIDDGIDDPRTPSKPVPASVKWINDQLDKIVPMLEHQPIHPLKNNIAEAHRNVSEEIRKQSDNFLCKYIVMSSCEIKEKKDKWIEIGQIKNHNVDNWDENEEQSLETVVYSLSVIKVCKPSDLEIKTSPVHATLKIQNELIDIIVVCGETHDKCSEYAKQYLRSEQRFGIIVTRDINNTLWDKKFRSCLEGKDVEISTEKGPDITDPDSRYDRCGYQNLISSCFNSQDLPELNNKIKELIRCIK